MDFEKAIFWLLYIVAVVGVILGIVGIYKAATSSGKVDYCYIENINGQTGGYEVIGHRPWRSDAHLGVGGSPEAANAILSQSVLCPK